MESYVLVFILYILQYVCDSKGMDVTQTMGMSLNM
jgi:hypothetical protein